MSLEKIYSKKSLTILGLNSGTSADGLDMVVVRASIVGGKPTYRYIHGASKSYPAALRKKVLELADAESGNPDELIYLDNLVGKFFGRASAAFIRELPPRIRIDAIASHGQTVRHLPKKVRRLGQPVGGTLQIGSPEFIAAATGCVVVSDFRQADVALGGEGAPITVAAMRTLFKSATEPRLIVNIGGMSNYFFFDKGRSDSGDSASDCGPGNSLSDILSQRLYQKKFDRGGRRALRGKANPGIVGEIMRGPFFKNKMVSTGRELFGAAMAERIIKRGRRLRLKPDDILATAAEITVRAVARKVRPLLRRQKLLTKLYLTGGGRYNIFFVEGLERELDPVAVLPIDDLGVNGDFVEAAAYAVMGEGCLRSRPIRTSFKNRGGKSRRTVPGRITQPPEKVRAR